MRIVEGYGYVLVGLLALGCERPTFEGLGHQGSRGSSHGYGVSGTGATATGDVTSLVGSGTQAFTWTAGTMTPLPRDTATYAAGYDLNDLGTVIAGHVRGPALFGYATFAALWTNGGSELQLLGPLPDFTESSAHGVNGDGSVVVGQVYTSTRTQAFRWTSADGMEGLGYLNEQNTTAWDVSDDGEIVAGTAEAHDIEEAFRWTRDTGLVGLGTPTGWANTTAWDISGDGATIVGAAWNPDPYGIYPEFAAFRWNKDFGSPNCANCEFELLGDAPEDPTGNPVLGSSAFASNQDGSVIVGVIHDGAVGRAMIWDEVNGMRDIAQLLKDEGALPDGWWLFSARGVSDNGEYVVGTGMGPDGNLQGWIARIPQ